MSDEVLGPSSFGLMPNPDLVKGVTSFFDRLLDTGVELFNVEGEPKSGLDSISWRTSCCLSSGAINKIKSFR